jgi:hypothetical protein
MLPIFAPAGGTSDWLIKHRHDLFQHVLINDSGFKKNTARACIPIVPLPIGMISIVTLIVMARNLK